MFGFLAPSSPYNPPSLVYTVLTQPVKTQVRFLSFFIALFRPRPVPGSPPIRLVCISDTHCVTRHDIPDGDVLIHAGDLTDAGTPAELQQQIDWLDSLPHGHKIVIAGNHDTWLDPKVRTILSSDDQQGTIDWKNVRYLQHTSVSLDFFHGKRQLSVFGAPQTACGNDEFAFQYPKELDAWTNTIPDGTDILVTHSPPKYHLDLPAALGDENLLREVCRVLPKVHVFGHIHSGRTEWIGWLRRGRETVKWDKGEKMVERALSRPDGLVRGLIHPRSWLDLARVAVYGLLGIIWEQLWGGKVRETIMVNAALMYDDSGKSEHTAQIVYV
ncbi:calcineurin-like phosphoesterase [Piedraia hortae CBS 480.64]|uniref:Calcineurin-like phosphoesterase n=1 Tax=Piedraia hortae CBS 480.64 TaxID=1314780 RepID=A0A6A7C9X1_9PEZI|nr:calcineurin-like phosphoesterase [Piedraia hortae CBS 480.64]